MFRKFIIIAILALAFSLRFYKLGEAPASLNWDENSNGYNAYSILKTGRDEYGNFLPLTNRSFDDYKPPLYMYLNVITVAIFGLNSFAVRLPSALLGFLTIPLIYLLSREIFKKTTSNLVIGKFNLDIGIVAMFLLAISPWHIHFSRIGFEANVGLFFIVSSVTLFLLSFSKKLFLIPSAILLGLTAYTYHSERIFAPLLFLAVFIIFKKEVLQLPRKYLAGFIILTGLIVLPLLVFNSPKNLLKRLETTSNTQKIKDIDQSIKFIIQDDQLSNKFRNIIHNRRIFISQTFFQNYLANFDFNYLFTTGDDNSRHHIDNMGMLYFIELPLILYGIFLLMKNRSKASFFIFSWLLLSPIPSALSFPNPHANRSLHMVIVFQLICAYSIFNLLNIINYKKLFLSVIGCFYLTSLFIYTHNYWRHYTINNAGAWQFGYGEAALETEKIKNNFDKIYIDSSIEQAYIFWLFNTKYDPTKYQISGNRYQFDKYYFEDTKPHNSNELLVSTSSPAEFEIVKTIYYPNGQKAVELSYPK